jgi:kumamolisin
LFPSMRSDDAEFQLAKAAGLTVVAASGDTGSDDCGPGSHTYRVDYPSSSPYVTGVGGTSLHLGTTGSSHETTWGHPDSDSGTGGGGGASILYPMPSWQTAPGVISPDTHSTCGAANDQPCREVPDVSFDANPNTGYIIYSGGKWRLFGGTSAGAPLLAAIIADADTYSIAHGGGRMGGSANPFFYAQQHLRTTRSLPGDGGLRHGDGARRAERGGTGTAAARRHPGRHRRSDDADRD